MTEPTSQPARWSYCAGPVMTINRDMSVEAIITTHSPPPSREEELLEQILHELRTANLIALGELDEARGRLC